MIDIRQQIAIEKERLLPIPASDQVCSKFGIHPDLSAIKGLYDDGDLLFFANTGALPHPMDKDEFEKYRLTQAELFAHNKMITEAATLDPHDSVAGTGILGRMAGVLSKNGYNAGSFGVRKKSVSIVGRRGTSNPVVLGKSGIGSVYLDNDVDNILPKLHNKTEAHSGLFADSFSDSLVESIANTKFLENAINSLGSVTTSTSFPNSILGQSLKTIAQMIATRETRSVDVDMFYVQHKGK